MYYIIDKNTNISLEREVSCMRVFFPQTLNLSHSKEEIISSLICQRIHLLVGARKASRIEKIYFGDPPPENIASLSDPISSAYLTEDISVYTCNGKFTLYCTLEMLDSLIRPKGELPAFDDAMLMVSSALLNPSLHSTKDYLH